MILNYSKVYCTSCALYTAHSKGHWLSGSLLWDYWNISKFRGIGSDFQNINESK